MPLSLKFKINEGINLTETSGKEDLKSIDVIVRDISFDKNLSYVLFELLENGESDYFSLSKNERHYILDNCTLSPEKLYGKEKILLTFFATKEVEIGRRKIYPV